MKTSIYDIKDGIYTLNLEKLFGKGYDNGLFFNCNARYRLFEGARNTKKSKNILGYEPLLKIIYDEMRNVMICRQNDSDNRQSTFENIVGCIYDLGWEDYFLITKNPLEIKYKPTGQKIIFRGLNNPTSLNSITFSHGYLTDVYIEEAFELTSYDDFRKLDGSLRGMIENANDGDNKIPLQITMCFNAWDGESWLYTEFFKDRLEDDYEYLDRDDVTYMDYYNPDFVGPYGIGLYLHKSTYKINEFRDKEIYDRAAKEMKEKAPEIYKVEYLGMFGVTGGKVYTCWNDELAVPIQKLISENQYNQPVINYTDFAIGIDTGLSDGAGKVIKVKKGEDQDVKVKAATTMALSAITADHNKLVVLEEYFHSNNKSDNASNTDNRDNFTEPQQINALCEYIRLWINKYESSNTIIMKGIINIYVDCADIGFRQVLEIKLREYGIYNCRVMGSTKKSIRTRVSFTNLLMAYGDYLICDSCKNLIREIKNCRKGEGNIPRADGNDHIINAVEYSQALFYNQINRWKSFKEH